MSADLRDDTGRDAEAARIYAECYTELVRHLQRLCGEMASAEDLAQEAGMRLLTLARTEPLHNPRAFLFHAATNLARDQLRRRLVAEQHAAEGADASVHQGADHVASMREEVARVSRALDELTPRARQVLLLARVEGHSQKEVAARLNLKPRTVENHLTRALAQLAAALRRGGRQ